MWEGGRTLNRLTQAPPLRSARIQRLSSRSWHPRHPFPFGIHKPWHPFLLKTLHPDPPITYNPTTHNSHTPPYPSNPNPTIATVSCKTCQHAIGWMCTEKWPTKTPLPESMWRQRYLNMFIDGFSPNFNHKINKLMRIMHGTVWNQGKSKVMTLLRQLSLWINVCWYG